MLFVVLISNLLLSLGKNQLLMQLIINIVYSCNDSNVFYYSLFYQQKNLEIGYLISS